MVAVLPALAMAAPGIIQSGLGFFKRKGSASAYKQTD